MTAKGRAVLLGGMGYPATEMPAGLPTLKHTLETQFGFECIMVNWSHRQEAYNFAHAWLGFLAYFGDSLGAGSAGQYPGDLARHTDFAGGFQPSEYDARSQHDAQGFYQLISPHIAHAHCVTDPWWIDTGGLGYSRWRVPHGSKTILSVTEHRSAHPDDWSWSQTLMLTHMKAVMAGGK